MVNLNKLWIFQSDKLFTTDEIDQISKDLRQYLSRWNAHGVPLKSRFEIRYNRFIIIHADQSKTTASGCAIDDMTRLIKSLERKLKCSLLDRMNVAYKENNTTSILPLAKFKQKVSAGTLSPKTIIFNNSISTLEEYRSIWEVPIKHSWAKTLVS